MITSRRRCGTTSRNRASRLPISSDCWIEIPVTLPSGRAKLAIKPPPGSDATAKTIGMVVVACCTTAAAAPYVTITSTCRRENSTAKSLTRLELPPAQRYSTSIESPVTQPSSRRRVTKAAVHELQTVASAPSTPIRRSPPTCCAYAAMGHVPTRPQTILINSRRSIEGPLPPPQGNILNGLVAVTCVTPHRGVPHVRFGSKADIGVTLCNVRFTPKSGHSLSELGCLLCAKSRHPHALSSYPTFILLNVELVACRTSRQRETRPRR